MLSHLEIDALLAQPSSAFILLRILRMAQKHGLHLHYALLLQHACLRDHEIAPCVPAMQAAGLGPVLQRWNPAAPVGVPSLEFLHQ